MPTVADLLRQRLGELSAELRVREAEAREHVPGGVHQMRVTARRVRSLLASYRPLLDRGRTEPVRAELGWLTGLLGDVRDPEVLVDHLTAILDGHLDEDERRRARERITSVLAQERQAAFDVLTAELGSRRYEQLVGEVAGLAAAPPVVGAGQDARDMALRRLRHDWRRLERLVAALPAEPSGRDLDLHLHAVRKAAKRVRYVAETAERVPDRSVTGLREAATVFQERLGEHQDALMAEAYAGRLASQAAADGEPIAPYEHLARTAAAEAARVAAELPGLWAELELSRPPRPGPAGR